jgi:hypothetical protein
MKTLTLNYIRSGRGQAANSLNSTSTDLARPAGLLTSDWILTSHFDSKVMMTCGAR